MAPAAVKITRGRMKSVESLINAAVRGKTLPVQQKPVNYSGLKDIPGKQQLRAAEKLKMLYLRVVVS